jgi:hypothetical protein
MIIQYWEDNMMNEKKLSKNLVGIAGVHFVVGELTLKGWTALPTIGNTQGPDIIAQKGTRTVQIQVKTAGPTKKMRYWPLQKSAETLHHDDLFYIFVALPENELPSYYIIPSKKVADYIKRENERARIRSKELGRTKESSIRGFPHPRHEFFPLDDYKGQWKLLEG